MVPVDDMVCGCLYEFRLLLFLSPMFVEARKLFAMVVILRINAGTQWNHKLEAPKGC
jgi:hypothetical protein